MSVFRVGERASIGCDEGCDIPMEDKGVSAQHCTIERVDGRYILNDLDSREGTFVNGIPVKQREIVSGDEIVIGNSAFLFSVERQPKAESSEVRLAERSGSATQV